MKQTLKETNSGDRSSGRNNANLVAENQLYNLLFTGRISLKEYLQRLRKEKLQQLAA